MPEGDRPIAQAADERLTDQVPLLIAAVAAVAVVCWPSVAVTGTVRAVGCGPRYRDVRGIKAGCDRVRRCW